jgi:G6PDH family F420-dependent oxidoreductase
MRIGYAMSSEELAPGAMLRAAIRAEEVGFRTAWVSDHFHPWISAQGESPFVWTMLGAIGAATDELRVGTGVTCPTIRIHPAIIAQAAATTAALVGDGRFFLGVGSGEQLNEHVTGEPWPTADTRLSMLEEAIGVLRELWGGEEVTHYGEHFVVEDARIYSRPGTPPPIYVSAFGPKALDLAIELGDGWVTTSPDDESMRKWRAQRGDAPAIAQLKVAWARSVDEARKLVVERWPTSGLSGELSQELRTPRLFEQAVSVLSDDQIVSSTPVGPDVAPFVEQIDKYRQAGFDELYLTQVGSDQAGFLTFCERELFGALPSDVRTERAA